MAKGAVELMFFFDKPYILKTKVDIQGRQNLDAALARGQGVILVSAHFGNFPLLLGRLAVEGYKHAGSCVRCTMPGWKRYFLRNGKKYGVKDYLQPAAQ